MVNGLLKVKSLTFKQMIKYLGCSGKDLKGLKKFKTLFLIKEVENEKVRLKKSEVLFCFLSKFEKQ